jgi:hypothetical protein
VIRLLAALLIGGAFALGWATPGAAEPPSPAYLQSVEQASAIIEHASAPDVGPADAAYRVLRDGTGDTQPEILADLRARPPLYDAARQRLSALTIAIEDPMTTPDQALASQRLHQVMAQSRYDALRRPPSLLDRALQWLYDRVNDFINLILGRRGGVQPPAWWLFALGIAVVAAIAFIIFRSARGRFTQSLNLTEQGPRPAADYFAEADRFAARGNRVAAIRALCAGVAATIEGERSWEGSPLTVREIFARAPDSRSLRPLLAPFEAAVYGGRDVDLDTYNIAERVAARYRRPVEAVA